MYTSRESNSIMNPINSPHTKFKVNEFKAINQSDCFVMIISREALDLSDFLSTQSILILLTETVSHRKEFPGTLLVHFPHIGFLAKKMEWQHIFYLPHQV